MVFWKGITMPQEPSGAQPRSAVTGRALGPPLPRSGIGQHPGHYPHHPELLLGPVNSWGHAPGAFLPAGLLVYSNYLTERTLNWEPATHLAPRLVVEVDIFPKMHPSPCAPNAWTSKASTRKPFQKLERIVGCCKIYWREVFQKGPGAGKPWSGGGNVPPASKGLAKLSV